MHAVDLDVILRYSYEISRDVFSPTLSIIIEREGGIVKPNFHTGYR